MSFLKHCPVDLNLLPQQSYLSVSPDKIASERSDHCNPFDNVSIEGSVSIRKIAAGSGAGLGHRAISGGSALGVCAQPVSASSISASDGIAHRLRSRERIGYLLGGGGVAEFLETGGGLVLKGRSSAGAAGLGHVGTQLGVVALLGVQAPGLRGQQAQQHQAGSLQGVGLDGGDHVNPSPHLPVSSARRLARPCTNV